MHFFRIFFLSLAKEWKSQLVNSGSFNMPSGHHNPNFMAIKAVSKEASPVYVGNYQLSKGLINRIGNHRSYQPKDVPKGKTDVKILGEYFYHSLDPQRPQVCF